MRKFTRQIAALGLCLGLFALPACGLAGSSEVPESTVDTLAAGDAAQAVENETAESGNGLPAGEGSPPTGEDAGPAEAEAELGEVERTPITLAFTGDINLDDSWENMRVYYGMENGIYDCISAPLLERMHAADILLVNNEFTYSYRGQPMADKLYTFRAAPGNAQILQQMGVDIVSLANNHVYDYGENAFVDTLDTLDSYNLLRVGAGRTIAEATAPVYVEVGGITVAYVAASRAEKYFLTPGATEDTPGIFLCYDDALFLQATAEAAQNADFVVAYPHWGTENTHTLEDVQVELAHKLVDAGADLVVGAHPHVLQGIEYYNGKPVFYSLGNFWFNTDRVDTALLEVEIDPDGAVRLRVQPCLQTGGVTSLLQEEAERRALFDLVQSISFGISIDEDGYVHTA